MLKDYEKQKQEGKDPVFDLVKLGIKDADFWKHEYDDIDVYDQNNSIKDLSK